MSNSLTLGFLGVLSLNVSVFRLVIVPFTAILLVWVLRGYAFIPLKHLPGPWFTRLFSLRDRSGRPVHGKQLLNLHQKYGPLVRLGPNLISVQGNEVIQTIYGPSSKWTKPQPVRTVNSGCRGFLQITSHGVHRVSCLNDVKCRKILEPSFSTTSIAQQQHTILNCADTALTVTEIACENEGGKVDILQIARTYAFDVLTEIVYGGSWQGRGTHSERKAHLNILDRAMKVSVLVLNDGSDCKALENQWIPESLRGSLRRLTSALPSAKGRQAATLEFESISSESVKAYLDDFICKPGSSRGCLASLIESKDEDASQLNAAAFTELFVPLLVSGVDTISALVTFALWDFGRFPDFRKRAAEEVAKFFPSRDDMTALDLEELPFLNAFLNESMRIHELTVALNERTPPAKGAELLGQYIPPEVIAICNPWSTSMDPRLFSQPENFDPDRWLNTGTQDAQPLTMLFSHGIRACLGRSLADASLRFIVASMLFEYDFEVCSETDNKTISELEKDFTNPWRRKLVLNLTARQEEADLSGYSIIDL